MPKKIPQRQCTACREHRDKSQMARIVRTPEGNIIYDIGGKSPGRGAYVCKTVACLERAMKARSLARALDAEIPPEAYDAIKKQIKEAEDNG